jgi:F-type H+-transporting ATPase subunit a
VSAKQVMAQAAGEAAQHGVTEAPGAAAGHEAAHGGGFHIDPLHQFEIKSVWEWFGIVPKCAGPKAECLSAFTFTNTALFMVIAVALISFFMLYGSRSRSLIPDRLQSLAELTYEFVAKMVRDNTGQAGMQYLPFVFSIFTFILALNMMGMVPYSYTSTSQIIVTFGLAITVFTTVTLIGFIKHGVGFLKLFVPDVPAWLLVVLIPIEVISYCIRPFTLSIRLFANMMAGHMMLKVFAYFAVALGVLYGIMPLMFMLAFTALEILVAFLQAYVFAVLTCIYLNDALHGGH